MKNRVIRVLGIIPKWCRNSYLLALVSLGLYALAMKSTYFAEHIYARNIYKYISTLVNRLFAIAPFSVIELLIIVSPIAIICMCVFLIIKTTKKTVGICRCFACILGVVSILFTEFVLLCGINYYRESYAQINGIEMREHDVDELYKLCSILAQKVNDSRAELSNFDDEGRFVFDENNYEVATIVKEAFCKASDKHPELNGYLGRSKPVLLSRAMSYTETTGIYMPFTVEANVNVDIPDYQIPYTMAHEMAHASGFMREDEANYIGYLVCVGSEDARLRYCGYMFALSHSMNQLYAANEEYYREIWNSLDQGVKIDRVGSLEYWKQFADTKVAQTANKVNNSYLKANGQSDGTKSYGRMVDLLLAEYIDGNN